MNFTVSEVPKFAHIPLPFRTSPLTIEAVIARHYPDVPKLKAPSPLTAIGTDGGKTGAEVERRPR